MNYRPILLALLTFCLAEVCVSQDHLEFAKRIGIGWQTDKFGWMGLVSFSPDGKMVASDGATTPEDVSGNLSFWTFPDGKLVRKLSIRAETLSSDWKYYATAHAIGELATGKTLTSLGDKVYAVHAFSPDSRYVAESPAGVHDSAIRVLELPDGKQVSAFGTHHAFALAISPDGVTLASGHWNVVTLWNLMTGERLAVLGGFGRYVVSLSFSKDGKFLGAGTDTGGIQIWDVDHRLRIHSLEIGGGDVSDPAFSPDDRLVAVGIYGTGTVYLVDVATGKMIDQQKVSDLGCGSVAFSPDGAFLITPSTGNWPYDRGGTIRVFDIVSTRQPTE